MISITVTLIHYFSRSVHRSLNDSVQLFALSHFRSNSKSFSLETDSFFRVVAGNNRAVNRTRSPRDDQAPSSISTQLKFFSHVKQDPNLSLSLCCMRRNHHGQWYLSVFIVSDALSSEVQAVRDDKGRLLPWWLFPRLRVWGECSTSHTLTALFLLLFF